jgi:hypothetical protein
MGNPNEEKLDPNWDCEENRKFFKNYLIQLNELCEKGEKVHKENLEEYIKISVSVHCLLHCMYRLSKQYQLYVKTTTS